MAPPGHEADVASHQQRGESCRRNENVLTYNTKVAFGGMSPGKPLFAYVLVFDQPQVRCALDTTSESTSPKAPASGDRLHSILH